MLHCVHLLEVVFAAIARDLQLRSHLQARRWGLTTVKIPPLDCMCISRSWHQPSADGCPTAGLHELWSLKLLYVRAHLLPVLWLPCQMWLCSMSLQDVISQGRLHSSHSPGHLLLTSPARVPGPASDGAPPCPTAHGTLSTIWHLLAAHRRDSNHCSQTPSWTPPFPQHVLSLVPAVSVHSLLNTSLFHGASCNLPCSQRPGRGDSECCPRCACRACAKVSTKA